MFNLSQWLKESMISGVAKGQVSLAYVAIKAEEYLSRGIFTEADVQEIAERSVEPVDPVPSEEPPEEADEGDISG
ncbi:MAG: hypothetical protein PHE79_04725 [Eubacteriales bacterium]|nr:hypothetical protein [Eubacteriales bacterium]